MVEEFYYMPKKIFQLNYPAVILLLAEINFHEKK